MKIRFKTLLAAAAVFAAAGTSVAGFAQDAGKPQGLDVKAFEGLHEDAFKLTMIQPGRRVVQLIELDAPISTAKLKELLQRREQIARQYRSEGRARYWKAAFCGYNFDRVYMMIEFPDVITMAESWERMNAGPELDRWMDDARAAGVVFRSQIFLDTIGGPPLSASNSTANAAPHVMQIMEMNAGFDNNVYLRHEKYMEALVNKLKIRRVQRDYQVNWHGERPRGQLMMVEYDSVSAMMRGNLVIDNSPEIKTMLTSGFLGNIQRNSECVTTEIR